MDNITISQKKKARLREWRGWIKEFTRIWALYKSEKIVAIPNAANLLNDYYWMVTIRYIKPLLVSDIRDKREHNIHYYKIISMSEISALCVMPFYYKDNPEDYVENKKLNAEFAFFVATSILLNWKIDKKEILNELSLRTLVNHKEIIDVKGKNIFYYFHSFKQEHINWLADLNTATLPPVLSNAQTWRMVVLATSAISNKGTL